MNIHAFDPIRANNAMNAILIHNDYLRYLHRHRDAVKADASLRKSLAGCIITISYLHGSSVVEQLSPMLAIGLGPRP